MGRLPPFYSPTLVECGNLEDSVYKLEDEKLANSELEGPLVDPTRPPPGCAVCWVMFKSHDTDIEDDAYSIPEGGRLV